MNKKKWEYKWIKLIGYGEIPYLMRELKVSRHTVNRILQGNVRVDEVENVERVYRNLKAVKKRMEAKNGSK